MSVRLIEATSGNIYGTTYSGGAKNSNCTAGTCGTVFKITLADRLTTLHSFEYTDGANPIAGLIQATHGNFYGTTGGAGTAELQQPRWWLRDGLQNHGTRHAAQLR